jgi:hypothetical protein
MPQKEKTWLDTSMGWLKKGTSTGSCGFSHHFLGVSCRVFFPLNQSNKYDMFQ